MADLLPSSPDPSAGDGGDPRVIGVDSDDADDLLAALQSETARDLLGVLYDEPATPSDLADEADTSIQNVRYHLDKLADADLVEVADTVYSEKGREMKVYAPAAKPLVVFAGNDDETPGIEAALSRLLGGLGILGLSSLAVQRIFGGPNAVSTPGVEFQGGEDSGAATTASQDAETDGYTLQSDEGDVNLDSATDDSENATDGGGGGSDGTTEEAADTTQETGGTTQDAATTSQDAAETTRDAADSTETATEATRAPEEATQTQAAGDATTTVEEAAETTDAVQGTTRTLAETTTEEVAQSTTTVADAAGSATSGLPPGLLFFAGGLVVLLALGLAWYLRGR